MNQLLKIRWKQILSLMLVVMLVLGLCPQGLYVDASTASTESAIPSDVTFEDLAQTAGSNKVQAAPNSEVGLGKLKSTANGFRFKLSGITGTEPDKDVKISVYSPTDSVWAGGYTLAVYPKASGNAKFMLAPTGASAGPERTIEVSDEAEVYIWLSEVTSSGHTVNVAIDGKLVFSEAMDSSVELGTNLYLWNAWTNTAVLSTIGNAIVFEDLTQTAGANTVQVAQGSQVSLGTLEDAANGFRFRLSGITGAEVDQQVRISVYNATDNILTGGYMLYVIPKGDGNAQFALAAPGVNEWITERWLAVSDEVEVYIWVSKVTASGHTVNVQIDGNLVFSQAMDNSVMLGKSLCLNSAWTNTAVVNTIGNVLIPSDVTFEDLAQTTEANKVQAASNSEVGLGKLASTANGFRFKLSGITQTEPDKDVKISVYSPTDSVWFGGYTLTVYPKASGSARFVLAPTGASAGPERTIEVSDEVEVYIWLSEVTSSGHTVNVAIDRNLVFSQAMDSSVELGTNLHLWNAWTNTAVLSTIGNAIVFEDIAQTARTNAVQVAPMSPEVSLGMLSSTASGFGFKLSGITGTEVDKSVRISVYNATTSIWDGGYTLYVIPKDSGNAQFALAAPGVNEWITERTIGVSDEVEVYIWISRVTDSGHIVNVEIDGNIVISQAMDSSVTLGTNLYMYSEWTNTAVLSAIEETVMFEDLAQTAGTNKVQAAPNSEVGLGKLTSVSHGFRFKLSGIAGSEPDKDVKISVYSPTDSVWFGGYTLAVYPKGSGNAQFALTAPGVNEWITDRTIEVSDEVEVYIWLSKITASGHTVNVEIDGEMVISQTMDSSVELGTNLYLWNAWTNTAVVSTIGNAVDAIPSNVIFEDLAQTAGANKVQAASNTEGSLGKLTTTANGFRFKLSGISGTEPDKDVKISVYNPTDSVWFGGYTLAVYPKGSGNAQFALTAPGVNEWITDRTLEVSDEVEVYIWLSRVTDSGHTVNVAIDGDLVISQTMDSSVVLGTNLYMYSAWTNTAVLSTIGNAVEVIPTDVTFEDLAQTARTNKVQAASKSEVSLGKLKSTANGFRFRLSGIAGAEPDQDVKISVYSTTDSVWFGGYTLVVIPKGQGKAQVMLTATGASAGPERTITVSDEIEVYIWISEITSFGRTVNVEIDGKQVFAQAMDNSVELGTNLHMWNGWTSTAVLTTIANAVEVIPSDVTFEDLAQTADRNKVELPPVSPEVSLGKLQSTANGFRFRLSGITETKVDTKVRISVYNATDSIWKGGYTLYVIPKGSGSAQFALAAPGVNEWITERTIGVSDEIDVYIWLSEVTASGHRVNVVINGDMIISQAMDNSVTLGTNLYFHSEWTSMAIIKSLKEKVWKKTNIPSDVIFEDIGSAMRKEEIRTVYHNSIILAQVKDVTRGFQFYMSCPKDVDYGVPLKIGLYNMYLNVWGRGYLLMVVPTEDGSVKFSLHNAISEALLDSEPEYSAVKVGEDFLVTVWISTDESMPDKHTIHIMIDDVELLTYTADNMEVLLGRYMQAYSDWQTQTLIKATGDVETFYQRYVRLYGDPLSTTGTNNSGNHGDSINGDTSSNDNATSNDDTMANSRNIWKYVFGGLTLVTVAAVGVTGVLAAKQRKKNKVNE